MITDAVRVRKAAIMTDTRLTAAILTHALCNSREKATAAQMNPDDWKLVYGDYQKFLGELLRQTQP